MAKMTERACIALAYINLSTGGVSASDIGRHMWETMPSAGSNLIAIGAAFIGRFRRAGLIFEIAPFRYAITPLGRSALAATGDPG